MLQQDRAAKQMRKTAINKTKTMNTEKPIKTGKETHKLTKTHLLINNKRATI